jgi:hypothetical protein
MSTQLQARKSRAALRPNAVPFDERLWPMVVVLLALAGLGAGAIVTFADFSHPRAWNSGWIWLGSLGVVTLLAILAVSLLDRARRSAQLAAALSLIFHILLFVALNQQRMTALAENRSPERPLPQVIETFRAPDYHIRAPDDPLEAHEKPVAAALPEEQRLEVERSQKQRLSEPTPPSEPDAPQPPEVEPQVVPLRQPEEAAPRLAESPSEISKAEPAPLELSAPEPVAVPSQQPPAELRLPQPSAAAMPRRELPLDATRVASSQQPPPSQPPLDVQVAALSPHRTPQTPLAADGAAPADARAARAPTAPQLRAPQIAEIPHAQQGVDEPLDEPQPMVKAPLRAGAGASVPLEAGTTQDLSARRVAIASTSSTAQAPGSVAPPQLSRRAAASEAAAGTPSAPAGNAGGALRKSVAAATVTPSPASLQPAASSTGRATADAPAAIGPATAKPVGKAQTRLALRIPAPEGVGGVAAEIAPDVGTPSRRARQESLVPGNARLLARTSGGPPTIDGRTREPAAAFARRPLRQNRDGAADETTEQTEAAIELGLVFLARHQAADGSWSLQFAPPGAENPDPATIFRAETAATGLALLSFLGAGYDHYGGQYAQVVQRALDYLVEHQLPSGELYQAEDEESDRSARLYSHGIAAIALCEAYGMTGDRALAAPAQRAIDFILASQDPTLGGWRYVPGVGSDTSVSGWQLMAMKSGELAGLKVPRTAYDKVQGWLDRAQAAGSQYAYNPRAPDTPQQRHGRRPSSAMTAVGLLMRLYTGLNRDDAHMIEGAQYLLGRLPENGTLSQPARDT